MALTIPYVETRHLETKDKKEERLDEKQQEPKSSGTVVWCCRACQKPIFNSHSDGPFQYCSIQCRQHIEESPVPSETFLRGLTQEEKVRLLLPKPLPRTWREDLRRFSPTSSLPLSEKKKMPARGESEIEKDEKVWIERVCALIKKDTCQHCKIVIRPNSPFCEQCGKPFRDERRDGKSVDDKANRGIGQRRKERTRWGRHAWETLHATEIVPVSITDPDQHSEPVSKAKSISPTSAIHQATERGPEDIAHAHSLDLTTTARNAALF